MGLSEGASVGSKGSLVGFKIGSLVCFGIVVHEVFLDLNSREISHLGDH